MAELELIWAIIMTVALVVVIVWLYRKHQSDINVLRLQHEAIQKITKTLGRSEIRGELNEILGSFALLNEYQQLASLASVSKAFSIDLLGIKEDSVDFIEVKSMGTPLSKPEKKVKQLIEEKKVRYRIIEGNLPKSFQVTERE